MKETVPYELIETLEDGTEVREYPDGAIRNQFGQLMRPHPNAGALITSENARQMRQLRKEKVLDAIEKHVSDVVGTTLPADAIGMIVARRAKIAMSDDGRNGNEAAKIVLQAIDAYQDRNREEAPQVTRHQYSIDPETLEILNRFAAMKRGEIIEGEVKDG